MTEERKDGKAALDRIAQDRDHIRKRRMKGLFLLMRIAINHLRLRIKADDTPGISWRNPWAQLEFDAALPPGDFSKLLTPAEAAALAGRADLVFTGSTALQTWTQNVLIRKIEPVMEDGRLRNCRVILPPALREEVESLPESEREARLTKLTEGHTFPGDSNLPGLGGTGEAATPAGRQAYAFELVFTIQPLTITVKGDRAFFPVIAGLKFTEGDPGTWSEEDRDALFEKILKGIDDLDARVGPWLEEREAEGKPDHVRAVRPEDFAVAASFAPMHKLAERNRSGLSLFPEERGRFYELRTPLNWAVGLALFSVTSEKVPEGWQEVTRAELQNRVFCLTERDAPSRGDHWPDILAEVIKLHSEKNASARYDWEKRGRAWYRTVALESSYAIPNIELVYLDKKGHRVRPADPAFRDIAFPLEVKGRRVFAPDGKDIKALPKDRFTLDRIRWRWNPTFADDLKAEAALDAKGNVKKDAGGRVLRGGFNIRVAVHIFEALFRLRSEREYLAHDLLVLLAHDIYKPPKQSTAAGRNMIEREADRLYDLLGLKADPNHPERREEAVAAAVFRLKQKDIAALLPGSDERPRTDPNPQRRKALYYRLVRSPAYAPKAALVTKQEAAELEKADAVEAVAPALPPALPGPKVEQSVLPGMELPPAPPLPAGTDIRAAREAAGVNLRDFARDMKGPSFKTWQNYETGKPVRVESIKPDTWQRVRAFIAEHGPKAGPDGGPGP